MYLIRLANMPARTRNVLHQPESSRHASSQVSHSIERIRARVPHLLYVYTQITNHQQILHMHNVHILIITAVIIL